MAGEVRQSRFGGGFRGTGVDEKAACPQTNSPTRMDRMDRMDRMVFRSLPEFDQACEVTLYTALSDYPFMRLCDEPSPPQCHRNIKEYVV